jgi:hypothetical protein
MGSLDRQLLKARQKMIVERQHLESTKQHVNIVSTSPTTSPHVVQVFKPFEQADLVR